MHLLRLVMLMALLLATPHAGAVEEHTYPPVAEPLAPATSSPDTLSRLGREIYQSQLERAYRMYADAKDASDIITAFNLLRVHAIEAPFDFQKMQLDQAERRGWNPKFLEMLQKAIAWGQHMRQADGAYVWEQAKLEASAPERPIYRSVASALRLLSTRKAYPPAVFAFTQETLEDPEAPDFYPLHSLETLGSLAVWGMEAAFRDVIERHLTGDALPKHMGAAYYWLLKGEELGFDVNPWRSRVESQASDQDRAWATEIFLKGRYPNRWDFQNP